MKKKTAVTLAGAVLLGILVSLPAMLSMPSVQHGVLSSINARIPGVLQVASWTVGWRQGFRLNSVVYEDPQQHLFIYAQTVTGDRGLFALLVAPDNLGTFRLDNPVVVLRSGSGTAASERARGESDSIEDPGLASSPPGPTPDQDGKSPSAPVRSAPLPLSDRLLATLEVEGGSLQVQPTGQEPRTLLQDLSLRGSLADGSVQIKARGAGGESKGFLELDGKLNLPPEGSFSLDTLTVTLDARAKGLQLSDLIVLAGRNAGVDQMEGNGTLSGSLQLKSSGTEQVVLVSEVRLDALSLTGGPLGEDTPRIDRLDLIVDASSSNGKDWLVRQLKLQGGPLDFSATGSLGPSQNTFSATGSCRLPDLLNQAPRFFSLHDGVRVSQGSAGFKASATGYGQDLRLTSNLLVEGIRGERDGTAFDLSEPMRIDLEIGREDKHLAIKKLHIQAPFLEAQGKGSADNFSLQASANLDKASSHLQTLFRMPVTARGDLQLRLDTSSPGHRDYVLSGALRVPEFMVERNGIMVMPVHELLVEVQGHKPPPGNPEGDGSSLALRCRTWPGEAQVTVDNGHLLRGRPSMRYQLGSALRLDRLTTMLQGLALLHDATSLAGTLSLQANGFLEDDLLVARSLAARVEDFTLRAADQLWREDVLEMYLQPPVSKVGSPVTVGELEFASGWPDALATAGVSLALDLKNRGLRVRDGRIKSVLLTGEVDDLFLSDWAQPGKKVRADVQLQGSLAHLSALLRESGGTGSDLSFAGQATAHLQVQPLTMIGHQIDSHVVLDGFSLTKGDSQILEREKAEGRVQLKGSLSSGDLIIKELVLDSALLSLKASGSCNRAGEKPALDLSGSITPDLERLSLLINGEGWSTLSLSGRDSQYFVLQVPLGTMSTAERRQKSLLRTNLGIEQLGWLGLDGRDLHTPLTLEGGILSSKLEGQVNGGALNFAPQADYNQTPPLLRLADNSLVLSGAQLEKPLVDGLLGQLHPLFGSLATPGGTISLTANTFTWPLTAGGGEQASFAVTLDLREVQVHGGALLQQILEPFGLSGQEFRFRESELHCQGDAGRVHCDPLHILAAESEMILSGSVGFDQSLEYLLEIPVTEKLIGREGYRVLQNATVRVPISGTISRPGFDRQAVQASLRDLAGQAVSQAVKRQVEKSLPKLLEGIFGK